MTNTKYYILEQEVDKKTFDKYKDNTYEIGGVMRNLLGVQVWAKSKDIAESFPEEAAQAKAIYDQILSEISAQPQTKQKKTFHSFLDRLMDAYREELGHYKEIHDAFDIAQKEWDSMQADRNAPEHIKLIARGDYERAKLNLDQHKMDAYHAFQEKAKQIRKEMDNFAADFYRADPSRIDQNAMQLLNSGIMSAAEVEHLAMQYRDNPTMLRLFGQHAAKKSSEMSGVHNQTEAAKWRQVAGLLNISDRSGALGGFDTLVGRCETALNYEKFVGNSKGLAAQKTMDMTYSAVVNAYDNFILQPSGGSEA